MSKAKRSSSLWGKSITAVLWGLLISSSLTLNIRYYIPMPVDVNLLVGVLIGFTSWGIVMTYCYSCDTSKQANIACLKIFSVLLLLIGIYHLVEIF